MNYPLDKYNYVTFDKPNGQHVVAISTYAGKPVRGVAICAPGDEYALTDGMELAAARCNHKIAQKRAARAQRKYNEALDLFEQANRRVIKMRSYLADALTECDTAKKDVEALEKEF